jgi:hypothetical protein
VSTTEVSQQPAPDAGDTGLPSPAPQPTWLGVRWTTWRRLLIRLAPGLLYLGIRELGFLALTWMAGRDGTTATTALTSWDGQWYLSIASHGYHGVPSSLLDAFGHRTANTPLAFFPGYPELVRGVALLPGVDVVAAGLAVSLVCGIVGAYAVARLGRRVSGSPRVGLIMVVLFAASPMAIVLSMAYSEAMFCALAAWSLVGVLERRWVLAGLCALGAGLVRPTAAALVITVIAAAVVAIVRRRDGIRPWLGIVLAPAGLLAYLGFVVARTGSPTGWFQIQRQGWDSRFDGGVATVRFGAEVLASGRSVLEVVTVAVLLVAILLVAIGIRQRVAWPLVLYGALVLAMDLGSNGLMNSKARMLLPAFTLLLPVALALAKRQPRTMIAVLTAIAAASAWFGAYALTGWPYAI